MTNVVRKKKREKMKEITRKVEGYKTANKNY